MGQHTESIIYVLEGLKNERLLEAFLNKVHILLQPRASIQEGPAASRILSAALRIIRPHQAAQMKDISPTLFRNKPESGSCFPLKHQLGKDTVEQ